MEEAARKMGIKPRRFYDYLHEKPPALDPFGFRRELARRDQESLVKAERFIAESLRRYGR